jgi:ribA/ribD-fused uncharacterized protein
MKITNKYVFFWNGIYSQWYSSRMTIDGIEYNCCEQYMMHQKALTFGDTIIAEMILESSDPKEQKALGRKVSGFNKDKWDDVCIGIVFKGNLAKFSQNELLKKTLLSTDDKILVEASPYDKIWGIGLAEDHSDIEDPSKWKGLNLLGWSITMVKKELAK